MIVIAGNGILLIFIYLFIDIIETELIKNLSLSSPIIKAHARIDKINAIVQAILEKMEDFLNDKIFTIELFLNDVHF